MQGKEIMAHDPWATYERYEEMMNALDNLQISNECMEKLIKLSKDMDNADYVLEAVENGGTKCAYCLPRAKDLTGPGECRTACNASGWL